LREKKDPVAIRGLILMGKEFIARGFEPELSLKTFCARERGYRAKTYIAYVTVEQENLSIEMEFNAPRKRSTWRDYKEVIRESVTTKKKFRSKMDYRNRYYREPVPSAELIFSSAPYVDDKDRYIDLFE
jgi:hypothetical protein